MPYMLLIHVPTGLKLFKGTITEDCAKDIERRFHWFMKMGKDDGALVLRIEDEHAYYPMELPIEIARECALTIKYLKEEVRALTIKYLKEEDVT